MTRFISSIVLAGVLAGAGFFAGCEQNNPPRTGHDAQFSGGNGEFGTTPAVSGDYPNDVNQNRQANNPK